MLHKWKLLRNLKLPKIQADMKGRQAGQFMLRWSSFLSSLVQSPSLPNSAASASVMQCSTCPGSSDKLSFPSSDLFPFSNESFRWDCVVRNSRAHSACKFSNSQLYPPSSSSTSCGCASAQSYHTTSNLRISRRRCYADGAAKREERTCWACEQEMSSENGLFCSSCKAIQPMDSSVDFFKIFNIAQSFVVDSKVLELRYKDLQKKLHPDLAGSKSQREQRYSADQSSHVIQAYYILLRPLSRAQYLLGIRGIKVEEEGTIDDPELLMEIMEIRESIEEFSDAKELKQAQAHNNERILDCEKALAGAFRDESLTQAVSLVQRLAYYIKVGEEIVRKF